MLINISINKTQVCLRNIFSKATATLSATMNQKTKIIAPSKNAFQNSYLMDALQNCSLKKCISKLLSKICVLNKKDFHR